MAVDDDASTPPERELTPLLTPAEDPGPVIETSAALQKYIDALAAANGPIAVDAERASGIRYGQRNYLVQVRRIGAGTALIDPVALGSLEALQPVLADDEWVLHAASQDLHPLAHDGLRPSRIFDTEMAARLLNLHRVGLGAVVAELLGYELAKAHSAADWSTRPLPNDWLVYAALDVEVLIDLRDVLEDQLAEAGKLTWAQEEFEHIRTMPSPPPRPEPWRRISHITTLKTQRQLAVARALWEARDEYARKRDVAPGRTLPDRAIIAAARTSPTTVPQLKQLREFHGRSISRRLSQWQSVISEALSLPDDELPSLRGPRGDGPPQVRAWAERAPIAAERLKVAKEVLNVLGESVNVPVENLLQPDAIRRLCWAQPYATSVNAIADFLASRGARDWQIELTSGPLSRALEAASK